MEGGDGSWRWRVEMEVGDGGWRKSLERLLFSVVNKGEKVVTIAITLQGKTITLI